MAVNRYGGVIRGKPFLRPHHKIQLQAFAMEHVNKPRAFWKQVLWTDLSTDLRRAAHARRLKNLEALCKGELEKTHPNKTERVLAVELRSTDHAGCPNSCFGPFCFFVRLKRNK